jgi:hypothetical protein
VLALAERAVLVVLAAAVELAGIMAEPLPAEQL